MGIFLGVGTVLIYSEILKIHRKRPPRIIVTSWYGDAFRTSRQWFPLTQWPVMQGLGVFFVVSLNELSNTHSSYRWFQTPWRSCDATMLPIPSECLIMFALFFYGKDSPGHTVDVFPWHMSPWASCQIRKIADCACAVNAVNGFSATAG